MFLHYFSLHALLYLLVFSVVYGGTPVWNAPTWPWMQCVRDALLSRFKAKSELMSIQPGHFVAGAAMALILLAMLFDPDVE